MSQAQDPFAWVAEARRTLAEEFGPRAERALDRWPLAVDEVTLGGVACQRLLPKEEAPRATLLYFFGGGHMSGAPEYDLPITAPLCVQAQLQIIAPRYALAPERPFPAALVQAEAVWEAMCETLDTPPLLAGESAGGNLALGLVTSLLAQGKSGPARLALLSPWCDMTPDGIAASAGIDDPSLSPDQIAPCAQAYLQGHDPADPRASPGAGALAGHWPRTYMTTGNRDVLRPGVLAMAEKLRAAGAQVRVTDTPGMWHVFEVYDELPQAGVSLAQIAAFLRP